MFLCLLIEFLSGTKKSSTSVNEKDQEKVKVVSYAVFWWNWKSFSKGLDRSKFKLSLKSRFCSIEISRRFKNTKKVRFS